MPYSNPPTARRGSTRLRLTYRTSRHACSLKTPQPIYDFDNEGIRRDNIRHALVKDPLVPAFFESARAFNVAMNALPGVGEIRVPPAVAQRINALQWRMPN